MKEAKFSKIYFNHLYFYFEPKSFIFPISVIIDNSGMVLCFAFFGIGLFWDGGMI